MNFNDIRKRVEDSYVFYTTVIFCVTFWVFWKATETGFVNFDDPAFVLENPMVSEFSVKNFKEIFFSLHTANWQPLTWISHSFDRFLFGINPGGHHFTSVLIHSLNAVIIFFLFELIVQAIKIKNDRQKIVRYTGLAVSIFFAIHPLRIESVVWISERKDLLCAFFVLLAYRSYLAFHLQKRELKDRGWPVTTLIFGILALMSKPMAVTIPLVLLIFDFFPLRRGYGLRDIVTLAIEKWPFFFLSLVVGMITVLGQKQVGALAPITDLSFAERAINSLHNVFFYLEKTLLPFNLVSLYPHVDTLSFLEGRFFGTIFFFLGASLLCCVQWSQGRRALGTVWLYYLTVLAPVVGLIQVGSQAAADRYTYLPTLSFYFLVGGAFLCYKFYPELQNQKKIYLKIIFIYSLIAFICMGTVSTNQIEVWENGETLWRRNIKIYPDKQPEIYRLLGDILRTEKRYQEAEFMFKKALEINKNHSFALSSLGLLYLEQGRLEESKQKLSFAIERDSRNIEAKINLGLVHLNLKDYDKSQYILESALALDPNRWEVLNNLGKLLIETKKFVEAEIFLKKADAVDNYRAEIKGNLGLVYFKMGRLREAEIQLTSGLKIQPENLQIYILLAAVYIQSGLYEHAEKKLHFVLSKDKKNKIALKNLQIIKKRRQLELLDKRNEPKN